MLANALRKYAVVGAIGAVLPAFCLAGVGVGVGLGKIMVDEPVKPGTRIELPGIPVLNTGDIPSEYGMSVEFLTDQSQQWPKPEWFSFEPETFRLDPGQVQVVHPALHLPIKVTPGDYFSFLQAHPIQEDNAGEARIGVAAATKLYFTVPSATGLQGLWYATVSFYVRNLGWIKPLAWVLLAGIALTALRRYFHFNISVKR